MKPYRWDPDKNEQLIRERGLSFEQITVAIERPKAGRRRPPPVGIKPQSHICLRA